MLQQKRMLEEAAWSNPQIRQFLTEDDNPGLAVTLFDLVKTFQSVLERAKNRPTYDVGKEDVTIPDMIRFLRETFSVTPRSESISVTRLLETQGASRRAMLCLFLAILELVKRQAIVLHQNEAFGDIHVRRGSGFDEAVGAEQAIAAADQEYS
jgi:segregation and condensation protein A